VTVKVWKEGVKAEKGVVFVRLANFDASAGEVMVDAVDVNGGHADSGYLLTIGPGGVKLMSGVSKSIGLPLGCRGQLLIEAIS
jgi:hypothetical protein